MSKSCVGCKFLYGDGRGYSNYTWMETYVKCALGKNKFLLEDCEEPCDWNNNPENDNWEKTKNERCDRYSPGPYITLDPEREEVNLKTECCDKEQMDAIMACDGEM